MAAHPTSRFKSRAAGCIWALLLIGSAAVAFGFTGLEQSEEPPQPPRRHSQRTSAAAPAAHPLRASRPTRVQIPALRVDAPLTGLRLADDGRLDAPPKDDPKLAGWWSDGPSPGSRGTAIIAGHVDLPSGRAVFYDLGTLRPGMHIDVPRQDKVTARFTIDAIDVYDAADYPDDKVYADTGRAELRLITCGGGYDHARGQYNGNVVISAHLTGSR
ncbi:class F sortase [Streptomyces sp. NPDC016845]|uniref:class F sortase n=1 Tax=Streptomyces sp. NPDC016845 TaxID=3364972 RepID=UPI00379E8B6A